MELDNPYKAACNGKIIDTKESYNRNLTGWVKSWNISNFTQWYNNNSGHC